MHCTRTPTVVANRLLEQYQMRDSPTPKFSANYRRPSNWSPLWLIAVAAIIALAAILLSRWRIF
jgi:hypothetical protein